MTPIAERDPEAHKVDPAGVPGVIHLAGRPASGLQVRR